MRIGEPGKINSTINVTPLVDVVLVLLIIFMVMAPFMNKGPGPEVDMPATDDPRDQSDERAKIQVTIDQQGALWIDDKAVAVEQFGDGLRTAAGSAADPKVVIRGDARLRFGDVRNAMVNVEEAGFHGVGLIAERESTKRGG